MLHQCEMSQFLRTLYNFDIENINYHDNFGYRKCLRSLFFMKCNEPGENNEYDIDEETLDEMNYDEMTISKTMDLLYQFTQENEMFQNLYDLAAARMISTDRMIGQAVLFSYDYLPLFHQCLASFLNNREVFDNKNTYYLELSKKLT